MSGVVHNLHASKDVVAVVRAIQQSDNAPEAMASLFPMNQFEEFGILERLVYRNI
jgi:hypothetical protein